MQSENFGREELSSILEGLTVKTSVDGAIVFYSGFDFFLNQEILEANLLLADVA